MGPWWKERLDEMRRQERPQEGQPRIQLPLPQGEPPPETEPEQPTERGIAVIDFTL